MPIPIIQRLIAIIISLILVGITVQLIRKHRLREEYALVWLIASIGILLLSVFGEFVSQIASLVNVSYSPTLALVAGLLFALIVLLSQSVVISSQANRMRDLAQTVALLEWRLRELEKTQPPTENDLS